MFYLPNIIGKLGYLLFFPLWKGTNHCYDPWGGGSLGSSIGTFNKSQNWAPEPLLELGQRKFFVLPDHANGHVY